MNFPIPLAHLHHIVHYAQRLHGTAASIFPCKLVPSLSWSDLYIFPAIASFTITSFLICVQILKHPFRKQRETTPIPSDIRLALTSFVTPATCSWPSVYDRYLVYLPQKRQRVIKIHTTTMLSNIYESVLEFRDIDSLSLIFLRNFQTAGWKLVLKFDSLRQLEVLWWITYSQMYACLNYPFKFTDMDAVLEPAETTQEGINTATDNATLTFDLDYVPCPLLACAISHIQLRLNYKRGAIINFTALSPEVTFLGDSFLAAAIPFLPRNASTRLHVRTCSALLTPVQRHVHLLSSSFTIQNMSNVSLKHATRLQLIARDLADDYMKRTEFIEKWGIKSWREQRTMLSWEAGLLKAGILTRWQVVVQSLSL
ncbi:hypothetical protein BDQ17DRAFT_1341896 [Cyathus striatus]|nr:hypothetical protein BDQ17DRAFT_1341896 [Cyathus striatus]